MSANRSQTIRLVAGAAALAAIAGFGLNSLASSALFTDQESTSAASLSTGTIDISAGGSYATDVSVTGMMPGDVRHGKITITNATGSSAARLSSTAAYKSPANALSGALVVKVVKLAASTDACDAAAITGGTVLNSSTTTATTDLTIFGSATAGAQTGDINIAVDEVQGYCVQVTLPSTTGNTVKGLSTELTFTFDAEQTANNA